MKLNDLRSAETVHQEDMANDPDYRRGYLETRFANQVAIQIIRWRTEHGLTQTKLAEMLGMRQPNVARLEAGEHTPSLETLSRLSSGLGISFNVGIDPEDGIYLNEFRPHGEPGTDDSMADESLETAEPAASTGSLRRLRATAGTGRMLDALAIAEIKQRATLDLDEGTLVALHQGLANLVARLGQRRRPDAQEQGGRQVNIDAIFRDPGDRVVVFFEGFPGHRVNYLEVGSDSRRTDPAAASHPE